MPVATKSKMDIYLFVSTNVDKRGAIDVREFTNLRSDR